MRWGPTGRGAWMEGAHSSREMRPDSMGPLHKNESGEPPPGLCRQRRRRKERQHLLPACPVPTYYLFAAASSVSAKECAFKRISLSVGPSISRHNYTSRKRKDRKGRVNSCCPPSPFMFPIPRGHLLPGYSTSFIRDTGDSNVGAEGREGSCSATEKGRGEKLVIKSTFSRPLKAGWLAGCSTELADGWRVPFRRVDSLS